VISDIHGDIQGVTQIIANMFDEGFDPEQDVMIQLGDMIDCYEGYDPKEVVTLWRNFQERYPDNVIVLRGNHEQMIIDAAGKHYPQSDLRNWLHNGGGGTYYSYTGEVFNLHTPFVPEGRLLSDIEWFRTLPLTYETDDFIFVHAGLRPNLPLQAQKPRDLLWIREEFYHSSYDWGKIVVYGHTAREKPLVERTRIGLDTRWRGQGYVSGAKLVNGKLEKLFRG
jgi:serine/threonine protein phosphatase 1